MPIRLLITARDAAAALHLVQVARAGLRDPRFEIRVAVQPPASEIFESAAIAAVTIDLPPAKLAQSAEAAALRAAARALLDEFRPDAVLVGLSTPFDAGLDEAVLAESTVPSLLFQDFWGEQNLILGRGADFILVLDAEAAARNRARYDVGSTIVGSARHAGYAALDIAGVRAAVRRRIGAGPNDAVVGFFGQALHSMAGYRRTVQCFVSCLRDLPHVRHVVLRPHPREDAEQRAETERVFVDAGLPVVLLADGPVEQALLACNVVVSVFSTCTFDTAYLNRFSTEPVAVPISLLFDQEIAAYCAQHGNYLEFQYHTLGIVKPVYDIDQLAPTMTAATQAATCRDAWLRAHLHLPDPARAPGLVLDCVARVSASGITA